MTQTPIGENRFKQLVKKVGGPGEGGGDAEDRKEQGFKENVARRKEARRDVRHGNGTEQTRPPGRQVGGSFLWSVVDAPYISESFLRRA